MSERVKDDEVELHRLEPGRILDGRYEIIQFIGAGAFAAVYKARQLNIKRPVAIKVLNIINAWQDATTRKAFGDRFLREAQTAAQIRHTNVVTIYDFGIIADLGQPFIAMELLEGHDLEEELRKNGPMAPARAITLMLRCLEALGDGHELKIVHKDLKPANLYLVEPGTRRETLKIVDFGIARIQESENQKLTGTGQLFGTPQYLAPEYIEQQVAAPALDVYQMGLILVEMLTARTVVDVDNPYKCLMMHCNGDLPIPESLLQGAFGEVLKKSLAVDYKNRYPHANAFADALRDVDPSLIDVSAFDPAAQRSLGVAPTMGPDVGSVATTDMLSQPRATPTPDRPIMQLASAAETPSLRPAEPDEQDEAPRSGLSPVLIGVAVVLLLGVLVGVGVLAFGGDDTRDELATNGPPVVEPPVVPARDTPKEDLAPEVEPVVAPKVAAPETIEVEVTAEQEGARIFVGGQDRGLAPVRISFEGNDAAAVEVRVEKEGFQDAVIQVAPTDGPTLTTRLTPSALEGTPSGGRRAAGAAGTGKEVARKGDRKAGGGKTPVETPPVKPDTGGKVDKGGESGTGKPPKGMGFVDEPKGGNNKKGSIGFIE